MEAALSSRTLGEPGVSIRLGTEPGAPVNLRVRLAGRMRYGRIETR